jgi:hypothetical protein
MFECRIAGTEPDLIEFPLVEDTKLMIESSTRKFPGIGIVLAECTLDYVIGFLRLTNPYRIALWPEGVET